MYDRFEKLEEDKKMKIINAGLSVFSENGYVKTSIDKIVELADISKGSLFYYFESKKNFFIFLYAYCTKKMEQLAMENETNFMAYTDFFERLKKIEAIKTDLTVKYPYMYSFLMKAYVETAPAVQKEIQKINQKYTNTETLKIYENLDYSKFKEGINPQMVIQLVIWCSEGCMNQLLMKRKMNPSSAVSSEELTEIFQVFDSYMELLQKNFYKVEYL
ncbi:TetR/AcrR family transcriptional regulator [Anaerocolumna aminovalerica]|uniref:Regulatory protein, tetR family n=1 Tax=Anaerocolumna aminovalerica TaxID=1527 RepID=A0A1I5GDL3_9FIRM|nr:TetR/AcrR family transcriptional regulator [Anaerocolumna aminovalerica]MBU5331930.1 TetR/AcrR family transcriptional regulator [Anaerocolumna aminovalerica]SFO34135.1 regulatory protein, tetR family [Anaerocolumna aminovalerica]